MNEESELPADVLEAIHANRKIDAIKLLREHRGLELKDAKQVVDEYISSNPSVTRRPAQSSAGITPLVVAALIAALVYGMYLLLQ